MKLSTKRVLLTLKLIYYLGHLFQNMSHTMLDLKEIKELQNKENVIVNDKKLIKINDDIVIKKKGLYKIFVPMSLR